jgi:hypothetical protein
MKKKFIILASSLSILLSSSFASQADPNAAFLIENRTLHTLSIRIGNKCSNEFGNISPGPKIISAEAFNQACAQSPHSCVAEVFNFPNCFYQPYATLLLDVDIGVSQVIDSGVYTVEWGPNILRLYLP